MSYLLSHRCGNMMRLNRFFPAVFNPQFLSPRVSFSGTAAHANAANATNADPPESRRPRRVGAAATSSGYRRARVSDPGILSKTWDPLVESSYLHPDYCFAPTVKTDSGIHLNTVIDLKNTAINAARTQGYHHPTLTFQPVTWADHQAPFNHVSSSAMRRYFELCSFRFFESFGYLLGPDKWEKFYLCKGLGVMTHFSDLRQIRKPKFPDLLVLGTRVEKVEPDRFFLRMAAWSCSARARKIAELGGWSLWWDFEKNAQADMRKYGPEYQKLYEEMEKRSAYGMEKYNAWKERVTAFKATK